MKDEEIFKFALIGIGIVAIYSFARNAAPAAASALGNSALGQGVQTLANLPTTIGAGVNDQAYSAFLPLEDWYYGVDPTTAAYQ